jgi:hypothetical protein
VTVSQIFLLTMILYRHAVQLRQVTVRSILPPVQNTHWTVYHTCLNVELTSKTIWNQIWGKTMCTD